MLRGIFSFIGFFFCFFLNYSYGTNIASMLLNDQNFLKHYGEIGRSLAVKVQAWINVMSNRNLSLVEMEIIFSMYIPEKKKFFTKLENIIFNVPLHSNPEEHERRKVRRSQLLKRLLERKKRLYSNEGWVWHIQKINNNPQSTEEEKELATRLLYALIKRSILHKKVMEKMRQCKLLSHTIQDPYPLLLRNINRPKKIKKIEENYQCSSIFLNLCSNVMNDKIGIQKPSVLIQRYFPQSSKTSTKDKNTEEIGLDKFYCTFILLIVYIKKNHRKESFSMIERNKIFDFLAAHEYFVTKHFQGIGISSYFQSMVILIRKMIHHPGEEYLVSSNAMLNSNNHKNRMTNFIKFGIQNNNFRITMALEDLVNPYYKYELPPNFIENFEKQNNLKSPFLKAVKKVRNSGKILCAEFFVHMGLAAIFLRNFSAALIFLKTAILFSYGVSKEIEEYTVYLIVFSLTKIIEEIKINKVINSEENNRENNKKIEELYSKIEYWIKLIKKIGQTTIYGQLLCDLFANGYRKTSKLSIYANSVYHSIYKNTIKRKKMDNHEGIHNGQNNQNTSKYDWLVLMGIYILSKERTEINLEVSTDANGKKKYAIYNNKYAISSKVNNKLDYILKRLPKRALSSTTVLMKELVSASFKKYRYMLMLGNAIEEKTGIINALILHPVTFLMEAYLKDERFDYRVLSPIMQGESCFVMRMDNKDMNVHTGYSAVTGAGLFQINHLNAKKSAQQLKMAFSGTQLGEDIPYNFAIITEFIKNLQNWLISKHIINFIIAYNGGYVALKRWYQIMELYKIPPKEPAFVLVSLFLLHSGINRRYTNKFLSNYNKSIYWQSNNYVNIMLSDKRPFC